MREASGPIRGSGDRWIAPRWFRHALEDVRNAFAIAVVTTIILFATFVGLYHPQHTLLWLGFVFAAIMAIILALQQLDDRQRRRRTQDRR